MHSYRQLQWCPITTKCEHTLPIRYRTMVKSLQWFKWGVAQPPPRASTSAPPAEVWTLPAHCWANAAATIICHSFLCWWVYSSRDTIKITLLWSLIFGFQLSPAPPRSAGTGSQGSNDPPPDIWPREIYLGAKQGILTPRFLNPIFSGTLVSWFSAKSLKLLPPIVLKCIKFDFSWDSAPEPVGGASLQRSPDP